MFDYLSRLENRASVFTEGSPIISVSDAMGIGSQEQMPPQELSFCLDNPGHDASQYPDDHHLEAAQAGFHLSALLDDDSSHTRFTSEREGLGLPPISLWYDSGDTAWVGKDILLLLLPGPILIVMFVLLHHQGQAVFRAPSIKVSSIDLSRIIWARRQFFLFVNVRSVALRYVLRTKGVDHSNHHTTKRTVYLWASRKCV